MMADDAGTYWAREKEEDQGEAIEMAVKSILSDQQYQREMTMRHLRMYRNLAMVGAGPATYSKVDASLGAPLSLNVVRAMCNTVFNHVMKNKPKATAYTSGASWETRDIAKKIERYAEGLTEKEDLYRKEERCLVDHIVTGTSYLKCFSSKKHKRVIYDRVFPLEVLVDTIEGMHADPRSMYQIKYLDRARAVRLYPEAEDAIRDAGLHDDLGEYEYLDLLNPHSKTSDMVRLTEAYCLPTEEGADDGVMTVEVCGKVIASKPYTKMHHLFIESRWTQSPLGFHGMGLAEELVGIQLEINRLVRKIQLAMAIVASPYIMADRAANIANAQITNIPGTIILYNGRPPAIVAPQTVHPEVFAQLDRLYQRAFEIAGVNQFQAFGNKPAGIESGRAALVFQDVGSDRLASAYIERERMHLRAVQRGIEAAKEIPGYTVKVFGNDSYEELDFKRDIGLAENEYVLRIEATSKLADSPTGQIDLAERLIKAGLITKPEDMLEHVAWTPDIASYVKGALSPKRLIEKMCSKMLKDGTSYAADPHMNLALALDIAQQQYLTAKLAEAPEERLALIRDFMDSITSLIKDTQQAGAAAAATAPGGGVPVAQNQPAQAGPEAIAMAPQ